MTRPVLFDDVRRCLRELLKASGTDLADLERLIAVRDLYGRVRFVIDRRPDDNRLGALRHFAERAKESLGPRAHPAGQAFLYGDELPEDVREDLRAAVEIAEGPPRLLLLDRQVTGQGWTTVADEPEPGEPRRLAFYSLKGGVGRSTAVATTAWHLAKRGDSVLVVDLDLDAPGVSASLLPESQAPEHGIVDWFVEDAVGQGNAVVPAMLARAPLAHDLPGEVWVAPSYGADPGEYLAKLGRCYVDLPRDGGGREPWEERLVRLVRALEESQRPNVVLLDVRAGLSDLASVPVTDLGADVLLFALDTDPTWTGYRLLFEHWGRTPAVRSLRERLQLVAALVPETDRQRYLNSLRHRAWELFRDHLYDEVPPGEEPTDDEDDEWFSFDLSEDGAPHAPIPIFWNRGLAALAHLYGSGDLEPSLVDAAFGPFLDAVGQIVDTDEELAG